MEFSDCTHGMIVPGALTTGSSVHLGLASKHDLYIDCTVIQTRLFVERSSRVDLVSKIHFPPRDKQPGKTLLMPFIEILCPALTAWVTSFREMSGNQM